ncbi:unnamed protein product [Sphenostylis stenocarpa]|uniref:Albumin I chain a domain-containing protein n=1 Tax=Sphenostylis stenocarpa TaxID=92480 RepID=A0AA86W4C8_9FABA|nr:unnamed protein product [Sphenostylis stenocarpa]
MAFVRLAPLALPFLVSFLLTMKSTEAVFCYGGCSLTEKNSCGSTECTCIAFGPVATTCVNQREVASLAKTFPNLCLSHDDCLMKGSGNFCARSPHQYVDYGWCFDSNSNSPALKTFLVK